MCCYTKSAIEEMQFSYLATVICEIDKIVVTV